MPFIVPIQTAQKQFPQFKFVKALTPSQQKCAFHVQDEHGNNFCLKIVSPDTGLDRLEREITAMLLVAHPNVARLEEHTLTQRPGSTNHYMVEEFIDGSDLADQLSGTPWEISKACIFFAKLADGLNALRAVGVVHRDLKPQNIRVRPSGEPVIIDFGVARLLNLPDLTKTYEGARKGTPLYFAPEQFNGTKYDIDPRTDLFALGLILYEAIVGKHPFYKPGMTVADLQKVVSEETPYLADPAFRALPQPLKIVISRLLERDRISRLATAEMAATLLRKIGGSK